MKINICLGSLISILSLLLACGCGSNSSQKLNTDSSKTMKLTSSGFENGAKLDAKYTVEGDDASPPLAWSAAPSGTKSFALICDDPDAPSAENPADEPWVHWVLFNIPSEVSSLAEGIGREPEPAEVPGAVQGQNSWPSDNIGYQGPAPPPGSGSHRYFFKLYALDVTLDLTADATKEELVDSMSGHVLAEGELIGTYER